MTPATCPTRRDEYLSDAFAFDDDCSRQGFERVPEPSS